MSKLKDILVLDTKGYKDLKIATFACTLTNFTAVIPMVIMAQFVTEILKLASGGTPSWTVLWVLCGAGFVGAVIAYICHRFDYRKTYVTTYMQSEQIRVSVAERLRRLPMSVFNSKDLSDLTTRLMDDVASSEHVLSHLVPQLISTTISLGIVSVFLAIYDWRMACAIFVSFPLSLGLILLTRKIFSKRNKKFIDLKLQVSKRIQEYIDGMKVIRACNMDAERFKILEESIHSVLQFGMKSEFGMGVFVLVSQTILQVGLGITTLVGILLWTGGSLSLVPFILFLLIVIRIYAPILPVLTMLPELFYFLQATQRIRDLKNMPIMIGEQTVINEFTIKCEDVSFAYEKGASNAINGLSLTLNAGEITALVGPSGSGKSTMTRLIARFWDTDKGKITIGGVDIKTVDPDHLMDYMSFVFQDVVLFNDTVIANIRIGNVNATDEEVKLAARAAGCDEFIQKLPSGYETMLGENGATLSGGERQRISIARALLKNAPIVLLDEHMAAVDAENEAIIQHAISRLVKGKTVVVVAHRLRSIIGVDKIAVLDHGSLVECGTSQELLEKDGLFAKLYGLQSESLDWSVGKSKMALNSSKEI
ncbi:MAG: ABC transporter ATP-binding protein/permease [Christensenellaceae bacterium]|jgi:ATP-binding cassette subfamily B protein|nr:ABC transporter ATP-binding protein/permease [Christensenellaceae bacterium]